jgi:hypothetical protein
MINRLTTYLFISTILLISTFVCIIIVMIITGDRASGLGYGQIIGIGIGQYIYIMLRNKNKRFINKSILWIVWFIFTLFINYFAINYLPIDSTLVLVLVAYIIPVITIWKLLMLLSKKVKLN